MILFLFENTLKNDLLSSFKLMSASSLDSKRSSICIKRLSLKSPTNFIKKNSLFKARKSSVFLENFQILNFNEITEEEESDKYSSSNSIEKILYKKKKTEEDLKNEDTKMKSSSLENKFLLRKQSSNLNKPNFKKLSIFSQGTKIDHRTESDTDKFGINTNRYKNSIKSPKEHNNLSKTNHRLNSIFSNKSQIPISTINLRNSTQF